MRQAGEGGDGLVSGISADTDGFLLRVKNSEGVSSYRKLSLSLNFQYTSRLRFHSAHLSAIYLDVMSLVLVSALVVFTKVCLVSLLSSLTANNPQYFFFTGHALEDK